MKMFKIILDIIMTVLLLLLMKISFIGIHAHELIGMGLFLLFAVHKLLNGKWIVAITKSIKKGACKPKLRLMFSLDLVLFAFITFVVVSGILISQTIFTGITVNDIMLWSNLHHFTAYCSLMLISVHIGFHWQALINTFKKLLRLADVNLARTLLARAMLVPIAFFGIKAIINPEIYGNFTAPFNMSVNPIVEQTKQVTYTSKKETGSSTITTSIVPLSINSLVVDTPTLEDYLSKLFCSGCGRHCPLTALQCGRGTRYKNAAVADYEAAYMKNNSDTSETPASSEDTPASPENSQKAEESDVSRQSKNDAQASSPDISSVPAETPAISSGIPQASDDVLSLPYTEENGTSPLDHIGLMGIVIAGTHYTIKFTKK